MSKNYVRPGNVSYYTTGKSETVNAGDIVVIGGRLGVSESDIAADSTGAVLMEGVVRLPKVTGTAISQGAAIDYDKSEGKVTTGLTAANGDVSGIGYAPEAAGSSDTTVEVRLGFPGGTVKSS